MDMLLDIIPRKSDAPPTALARDGDVLVVDGRDADFAALAVGDVLPRAAVGQPWCRSDVTRPTGPLRLAVAVCIGPDVPDNLLEPYQVSVTADGPITTATATRTTPAWAIDIAQRRTAATVAAEALAAAKAAAQAGIVAHMQAAADGITGPVSLAETLSWAAKEKAAMAQIGGTADADDLALLDGEAAITGETRAQVVTAIMQRRGSFRKAAPVIAGTRRKMWTALGSASTPGAVTTLLATTKADFDAALAAALA